MTLKICKTPQEAERIESNLKALGVKVERAGNVLKYREPKN